MEHRRKNILLTFAGVLALITSGCSSVRYFPKDCAIIKTIDKVESFPDIPSSYRYFDYLQKARELDDILYSFAADDEARIPLYISDDMTSWNPIGFWVDQARETNNYNPLETGYLRRTFGMPTYVGDNRVASSGGEAMTTISSVLGSSYAGIDKQTQRIGTQAHDFVEMTFSGYDTGSKLVHNYGLQGQSFWYDIFPQIMFARLYDLYPQTPFMKEIVVNGANQWLEALPYFVLNGEVSYEFVGFNVILESPTLIGNHIEPPNGGLAFLFYSAYQLTKDEKYLDGAKQVLDYLQDYQKNPNYEALTDYAPFVAAVLNRDHGTNYDVGKFLDYLFDGDSAFRPDWSVLSGNFGNYAIDGLVGKAGDYAFLMNSLHLATVLAPMVKYDARYASIIGKYLLNLSNNARYFFPQSLALSHQSMNDYLPFDYRGALAYEGFRNNYDSVDGYAMGDATVMFSQPCDLSVYSSAFIGGMGALVDQTDVDGILKVDLNATDSFGDNLYPTYLFYNPFDSDKVVTLDVGDQASKVFDLVTNGLVASNVENNINLLIPSQSSKVVRILPQRSNLVALDQYIIADGNLLSRYQAAVNFVGLSTRQQLTASSVIVLETFCPTGDEIANMKISCGNIVIYDGEPISEFSYDKSLLPDTDYTLKVEITTQKGLSDYVTKRVVCR
ncbi:MAG: hypothetical protein WC344_00060 [Bacilli bacterium]